MQCWNCGFENMPGLAACARCTSTLDLTAITIEPPRASRWRVQSHIDRAAHRIAAALASLGRIVIVFPVLIPERINWRALAWSIVPGLGQIRDGRRRLGRALLGTWLALVVLLVLSIGTTWQALCYMLMVAVHALAVVTVFAANLCWERVIIRALFGLVVFGVLYSGLYHPAQWLAERVLVVVPLDWPERSATLKPGDGLLVVGPWLRPDTFRRGQLVLYQINAIQEGHYYIRSGHSLDRIVGVTGDRVQVTNGVLLVNGQRPPPDEAPLGAVFLDQIDYRVGPGEYVVFPTQLRLQVPRGNGTLPPMLARGLYTVQHEDVVGQVLLRIRPLSRFGRIQ